MRTSRLATAAAALAVVSTVLAVAGAADAASVPTVASDCVVSAALPARVSLGAPGSVTVGLHLLGSAACTAYTDGGEQARLVASDGSASKKIYWARGLDTTQQYTFWADTLRPGRYTVSDGQTHLYTSGYAQAQTQWTPTSTDIRYAGRVHATRVRSTDGGPEVTALAQRFSADDTFAAYPGATVSLQKRSGGAWTTIATQHAGADGRVAYRVHSEGAYRVLLAPSSLAWGATSRVASAVRT